MSAELIAVIAVIVVALAFDYTNGFHDAANAIATSVSTRALTPRVALAMAAVGSTFPRACPVWPWCSPAFSVPSAGI